MQYFVGLDWASREHAVCVVDVRGEIVARFTIAHTAAGMANLAAVSSSSRRPTSAGSSASPTTRRSTSRPASSLFAPSTRWPRDAKEVDTGWLTRSARRPRPTRPAWRDRRRSAGGRTASRRRSRRSGRTRSRTGSRRPCARSSCDRGRRARPRSIAGASCDGTPITRSAHAAEPTELTAPKNEIARAGCAEVAAADRAVPREDRLDVGHRGRRARARGRGGRQRAVRCSAGSSRRRRAPRRARRCDSAGAHGSSFAWQVAHVEVMMPSVPCPPAACRLTRRSTTGLSGQSRSPVALHAA